MSRYRVRIDSEIVKAFCDVDSEHQIMVVPNLYLEEHGKAYDASLLIRKDGTRRCPEDGTCGAGGQVF